MNWFPFKLRHRTRAHVQGELLGAPRYVFETETCWPHPRRNPRNPRGGPNIGGSGEARGEMFKLRDGFIYFENKKPCVPERNLLQKSWRGRVCKTFTCIQLILHALPDLESLRSHADATATARSKGIELWIHPIKI